MTAMKSGSPRRIGVDTAKQRLDAIWRGWSYPTRFAMILFAAFWGYAFVEYRTQFFWYLPAGFMLAGFVLLPLRYWPALILAEWLERLVFMGNLIWGLRGGGLTRAVTTWLQPIAPMLVAYVFRSRLAVSDKAPIDIGWMLLAMLVDAIGCGLVNMMLVHTQLFADPPPMLRLFFEIALGNAAGLMTLFPALLALVGTPISTLRTIGLDLLRVVLPAAVLFITIARNELGGLPPDYLRVLIHLPVVLIAWRHGWQGAAVAIAVTSSLNGLDTLAPYRGHHVGQPGFEITSQLVMMAIGATALLLGAAASAMRSRQTQLEARNAELLAANRANQSLASELREAAQRNLQLEATQRREIASALHDEFGQNLTAMSVRLKLVEQQVPQAGTLDGVRQVIEHMRRSVRRLLDNLSPAALDEFGLRRALTEGPLRAMVEDAGLAYRLYLPGNPVALDALPDHLQGNVYRIIQEALTNTVRHAQAHTAEVRMRLGRRRGRTWLFLDLRDDGKGMHPPQQQRRRYGLQGIRDRVLAANGIMHLRSDERGTRLHVMLRVE